MIALHDSEGWKYPNLALMKLSAHYKRIGIGAERFSALSIDQYDDILSSKVFTWTEEDPYLPKSAVRAGSGYKDNRQLTDIQEHECPDYSLYGIDYSMGFLTRGCNRSCDWCIVPDKEGPITEHADIDEFIKHKNVVLLDNNVLAHPHGISQIEKMAKMGVKVDFNQGLDARLIDDGVARRLAALKWLKPIRLACDHKGQIKSIRKAVELLRWHNAKPSKFSCYVLVKDIDDALERIRFLKGIHVDPFA